MAKTAKEFMEELSKNQEYLERERIEEVKRKALSELLANDQADLVKELNSVGVQVDSVWDLVNRPNNYSSGIPVLLRHLNMDHHPRILSGIIRALAVPECIENEVLWSNLLLMYDSVKPDRDVTVPIERGLQESLALIISFLGTPSRVSDMKFIIDKYPNSDGVNWIIEKIRSFEKSKYGGQSECPET